MNSAGHQDAIEKLECQYKNANVLTEFLEVRVVATGLLNQLQAARSIVQLLNRVVAVKLSAERQIGACIAKMRLRGGDRRKPRITLADYGITPNESSKWQALSRIPSPIFREYVKQCETMSYRMTHRGLEYFVHVKTSMPSGQSLVGE
ncbi:MAG: hypothetical protein KDB27_01295 [Planctomycetales bacterium]|nr:hypothetical protein [Planctomycetales bacterium]